ncbi:MAG TPA: arginase [Burkholderiaceae bacterium]|nr:arginase [Burkholderiaceae bacterium]
MPERVQANLRVSLIGAPTDIGASTRGSSMGPEALRVANIAEALRNQGLEVQDKGNLSGPGNPQLPPVNGYRHLDEVILWNRIVHAAVYAELQAQRIPILLGGDHSLAIGSISAVARYCREVQRKLRIVWFDAHADVNTRDLTPSGNLHGMPVACLCGKGPQELIEIGGAVPAIDTSSIRQIGIRSVDEGERRLVRDMGLQVIDMRGIDEMGMRRSMELLLDGLEADTHLHVSFDVDFLDPDAAPGVATAVRGGPTYREAQLCMEMIADTQCLRSVDIMELNPALDVRNQTAVVTVEFVESLFGKSTLIRSR